MDGEFQSPGHSNGHHSIEHQLARSHENFGEFTPQQVHLRHQGSENQGYRKFKDGKQSHGVKIRQELFTPQQNHQNWGYQHQMDYFGPRGSHQVQRGFFNGGKHHSGHKSGNRGRSHAKRLKRPATAHYSPSSMGYHMPPGMMMPPMLEMPFPQTMMQPMV